LGLGVGIRVTDGVRVAAARRPYTSLLLSTNY
jgi:hypothetical protein